MTRPSETPDTNTNDDPGISAGDPPQSGFARIARRISSRTTDLIAVGLVLIGSLTFGRQAVVWWRSEPEQILQPVARDSPNPWNGAPVDIEFGDAPLSLTRETVVGDREAALARLAAKCRASAESPRAVPLESPASDALLARLSALTPIENDPGNWSIYRLEEQFSLVVGVRYLAHGGVESAPSRPRLICFGMAVPAGESESTLFLFRGMTRASATSGLSSSDVIPDGFRRVLGLRGQEGEWLAGVAGEGDAGPWKRSLESKLGSHGWRIQGEWSRVDRTWSARFARDDEDGGGMVSVVMTADGAGSWSGVIHQSP